MFEDVAQMEKEIEIFRKNIVASSDLVDGITRLTEATKQHKESYLAATAELLKKIDACIIDIKADHEAALLTLSSHNDAAITNLKKNMTAEQAARMAELQQIKTDLESMQASYAERLQQTEGTIREYQGKLDDCVGQIKEDHEAALKALGMRVDTAISDVQKKSADDLAAKVAEINGIKAAIEKYQSQTTERTDEQIQYLIKECERLIAEMKSESESQQVLYQENMTVEQAARMAELQQIKTDLESMQASYVERLQQTENTIKEYSEKLDDCVGQIKADHEAALKALGERIDGTMSVAQQKSADDLAARVTEIDGIKAAIEEHSTQTIKRTDEQIRQLVCECERLIAEMKTELAAQLTAYSEKNRQTEQAIREYQIEAERKYKEFVTRLETTNVDQIFKEVQDLKQSIQTKFMILMCGISVAIVASVIGLILK